MITTADGEVEQGVHGLLVGIVVVVILALLVMTALVLLNVILVLKLRRSKW